MQLITPEYINNNLDLFKYLQKIGILPDDSNVRDKILEKVTILSL